MTTNNLNISEIFYSIQAEGVSVGMPAIFIRLAKCNLYCGGKNGELVSQGKATWKCDTENIWQKYTTWSNTELFEKIKSYNQLENILTGKIHIVWTGGEPTLLENVEAIKSFIDFIRLYYKGFNLYSEIETNGSIFVDDNYFYNKSPWAGYIQQINCSPKLSNSGMSRLKRINPKAIKQIQSHDNSWFKFVISEEKDIKEIQEDFINPFQIRTDRIILMPGVDNREDLPERTRFIFELGKKYCYRAITRQQIIAWDKKTGV